MHCHPTSPSTSACPCSRPPSSTCSYLSPSQAHSHTRAGACLPACLPALELLQGAPARVVALTSFGHNMATGLPLDDLNWETRPYSAWPSYGQSKLSNALFAVELARRWVLLRFVVLCCAVLFDRFACRLVWLCFAALCCASLCFAVLRCASLCFAVLHCAGAVLCCAAAGGFMVPRGQDVMISVYNIHRSPAGE